MLRLSLELTHEAGETYFGEPITPEKRTRIHKQDVRVNKLERRIRKQVIVHLAVQSNSYDLPYCLLLMSLIKDVERIGDCAKELAGATKESAARLPDDEIVAELREIRSMVETTFEATVKAFQASERGRAINLIRGGRDLVERCGHLIERTARSDHNAGAVTALVLGLKYYQRIAGHILNVLSSIVMPLHKVDYYNEDDIAASAA